MARRTKSAAPALLWRGLRTVAVRSSPRSGGGAVLVVDRDRERGAVRGVVVATIGARRRRCAVSAGIGVHHDAGGVADDDAIFSGVACTAASPDRPRLAVVVVR